MSASTRTRIRGAEVVRALGLALLATAVLPPAGAWWLNARRVETTTGRLETASTLVRPVPAGTVACGPGRLPAADARFADDLHVAWVTTASLAPDSFDRGVLPDAWGHCFLLTDRWLLSAGANGLVETPFTAGETGGDDLGIRVR